MTKEVWVTLLWYRDGQAGLDDVATIVADSKVNCQQALAASIKEDYEETKDDDGNYLFETIEQYIDEIYEIEGPFSQRLYTTEDLNDSK
jgi:hypothetical protein